MNRIAKLISCWLLLLVFVGTNTVFASDISLCADTEFVSTTITLKTTKAVTFRGITYEAKEKLSVTACWLEVKNDNGAWAYVRALPAPTVVFTDTNMYSATVDYSAYIGTGCYRIRGRFDADGHTVSVVSNEQSF